MNLHFLRKRSIITEALQLIQKAAVHSNEALNKIEKFEKILEVEKKLGLQLVSPSRHLLKEGDLHKISRTDDEREHPIRHIYLVIL